MDCPIRHWKRFARPEVAIGYNPYMLKFSTAGESHGEALIAMLSGLPAGVRPSGICRP